jgi:hypothetical protein
MGADAEPLTTWANADCAVTAMQTTAMNTLETLLLNERRIVISWREKGGSPINCRRERTSDNGWAAIDCSCGGKWALGNHVLQYPAPPADEAVRT